jgi:hypothetical protein
VVSEYLEKINVVLLAPGKASYSRQELSVAYPGTERKKKLSKLKHVTRLSEVKHVI